MHTDTSPRQELKQVLEHRIHKLESGASKPLAVMRAETRWIEQLLCEATTRSFPPIRIDEPSAIGGGDSAANPMELLLAALGACQEILYSAYAALMEIPLDSVSVSASGVMDLREMFDLKHECGAGFTKIRYETRIASPASEEQIRKLVETVERCCPVLDTLIRPVAVSGQVRLNDQLLGGKG